MKQNSFLNYGLPSNLSDNLDRLKLSVKDCLNLNKGELQSRYGFSKQEAGIIKSFLKRKPIPSKILYKALEKNNFTCCICKGTKSDAYIIHHINSQPSDNRLSNLAVLCPNDHDLAHKTGVMVTRKLSINEIRDAKSSWEKFVYNQRAQAALKPKSKQEWQIKAAKLANYVQDHLFQAHRGAILYDAETAVIFGNDGYQTESGDQRAKKEILNLRKILSKSQIKILGFGLADDEYSWCLIVQSVKLEFLNNAVWSSWPDGFHDVQQSTAHIATWTYHSIGLGKYF